jgi:hypothetical protein
VISETDTVRGSLDCCVRAATGREAGLSVIVFLRLFAVIEQPSNPRPLSIASHPHYPGIARQAQSRRSCGRLCQAMPRIALLVSESVRAKSNGTFRPARGLLSRRLGGAVCRHRPRHGF